MNGLFHITYGSRLYGTSTPSSDTDIKSVYLPDLNSLLLGHKPRIFKERTDAEGNTIPDDVTMPANGVETEYIPFQTFVRDFVAGQTYALEIAFAFSNQTTSEWSVEGMVKQLIKKFTNAEVYSMVGFARKQTLDYVHRGERLNEAKKVLDVLESIKAVYVSEFIPRLDSRALGNETVLDEVIRRTGLKTSTSTNNNRTMRTLELNGRSYLETTTLEHLIEILGKLVQSYGERSTAAAETDVDYKSLSHAVRVYQQARELLETGNITFPRPNAVTQLLPIKQGHCDLDDVKLLLKFLDEELQEALISSTLQKRTPELEAEAEGWLLEQLRHLYFNT
jgi:hypothetical protein